MEYTTRQCRRFMRLALTQARAAAAFGEAPVGCVIVAAGKVIAQGHNLRETARDPSAHAEIVALREAAKVLGTWRLDDCTMFVTLEPCPMCAGALVNARVLTLVYGAADPKAGACGTLYDIPRDLRLNHRVEVVGGVLEEECAEVLREFFRGKRGGR